MKKQIRHRKRNKKKQGFLVAFIGILLVFCVMLLLDEENKRNEAATDYKKDAEASRVSVSYNGRTYVYNEYLSNYLFLGIDTREEVDAYDSQRDAGQADAIFLVSMNRKDNSIQILSIPRDTIAEIEAFNPAGKSLGKTEDHINLQYAFGDGKHKSCNLMKTAVSELLYHIPIQGYCSLNMDGIPVLAELAGGVEVIIPDDSLEEVNPDFYKGASVTLTAENVEQFVRFRDIGLSQSALIRQERQKVFLQAYLKKTQEIVKEDASFVTHLYEGLQPYMVTNMGNDLFVKLLEAADNGTLKSEDLPGEGVDGDGFDEYLVDKDALYKLVLKMFYREDS